MKNNRIYLFFAILALLFTSIFLPFGKALASWYAGSQRLISSNGVSARIYTPYSVLQLVDVSSSGVSNWVSTYHNDSYGTDWLQTGWRYYASDSQPLQYVEWCIDCDGSQGTYEMHDQFASQSWGTSVTYLVERQTGARWCAYTGGVQRYCANTLYDGAMLGLAESEVHGSLHNPLDTTFSEVRYKSPSDGIWRVFDNQRLWVHDFPYNVNIYSDYYFHTYRVQTWEVYLPLVIK